MRKMESEGPYKSERWECQNEFVITGPGWEFVGGTYTKNEADLASRFANLAYDEGRASREMLRDALLTVQRWVSSLRCGDGMETLIQVMIKKVIEEDGGSK